MQIHQLAIIGAGPAGLTAAVFAVNNAIDTVLLEGGPPGGQLVSLYPHKPVYNYPGNSGMEAGELAQRMIEQAADLGIAPQDHTLVSQLRHVPEGIEVRSNKGLYVVSTVILACGMGLVQPRTLGLEAEQALQGRKLFYSVDKPDDWAGLNVAVAGGGDAAADNALMLMRYAERVTIIHRRNELKAQSRTIDFLREAGARMLLGWNIVTIEGDGSGVLLRIENNATDDVRTERYDRILVNIGVRADAGFLKSLPLNLSRNRVQVDTEMRTSAAGIYACGDVVEYPGKSRLIVTAAGEAATAVSSAKRFLSGQEREEVNESE